MKYELLDTEGFNHIKRTNKDGSISLIPMDESNSDYQAYLNKDKPQTPMVIDEASAE